MKYSVLFFLLQIICITGSGQYKKVSEVYEVPDSIKATGFYAEVTIAGKHPKKNLPRISANEATVRMGYKETQKTIQFNFIYKSRKDIAIGSGVYQYGRGNAWNYDWKENETYPLLILTASDSATHTTIYSGYIYLAIEKKWKLISTRLFNDTARLKYIWPGNNKSDKKSIATHSNRWLLRSGNTWKALDSQTTKPPVLRPFSNIDSTVQQKIEEDKLLAKLPKDSAIYKEGIFYQPIKEGTGRPVLITDTVVVHYKGWLFDDGSVFDETKEKPATFPLARLIRGWQVGVPQCRVGGKIRLFIPSGSAYGIRTFATDIPPNSTLVFDVEVLEVNAKVEK